MELVIKLSDKEYNELQSASYHSFDKYTAYLAMKNGTPLPPKESCGSCRHAITLDREEYCKKCSRYYRSMYDPMEYD